MRVIVTTEYVFDRLSDGSSWTSGAYTRKFWQRYLTVFDEVTVLARAREAAEVDHSARRVDGGAINVLPLPSYQGPWQYARHRERLARRVSAAVEPDDAVITRLPSAIGGLVIRSFPSRRPFGAEVVGDPWDVFAPGASDYALRAAFRHVLARSLRRQCRMAVAVAYVTRSRLQARYPSSPGAPCSFYSNVELPPAAFVPVVPADRGAAVRNDARLVTIASLAQPYKGVDVLLRAVAALRGEVPGVRLTVIGDGMLRTRLVALARDLDLARNVRFTGVVPAGGAIRAYLDQADLFVLASRTEGLPRAMLEAMARGLPCVGSRVGGIPELLADEALVRPGDADALRQRLLRVIEDIDLRRRMREGNLARARGYADERLDSRRQQFYRAVRDRTADWLVLNPVR